MVRVLEDKAFLPGDYVVRVGEAYRLAFCCALMHRILYYIILYYIGLYYILLYNMYIILYYLYFIISYYNYNYIIEGFFKRPPQVADEMYFISKGEVSVLVPKDRSDGSGPFLFLAPRAKAEVEEAIQLPLRTRETGWKWSRDCIE